MPPRRAGAPRRPSRRRPPPRAPRRCGRDAGTARRADANEASARSAPSSASSVALGGEDVAGRRARRAPGARAAACRPSARGRRRRTRRAPGSPWPRAALWPAASSSEPSSVVRSTDCVLAHRVLDRDVAAARIAAGQAQALVPGRRLEAPADDLQQAAADEHVLGAAAQALRGRQHADRAAAARQRRRELVVDAVQARDLLDQVGLTGHVVAPPVRHGRRRGRPAARRSRSPGAVGASRSPSA